MSELEGSVLEGYSKKRPQEAALVPGRFLFCMNCEGFTRHAVFLNGDGEKIIQCRRCTTVQARLVQWRKEDWVDRRYIDNLALTLVNIVGEKFVAKIFAPEDESSV